MQILFMILSMTLVHTTAYLKFPFSKHHAKPMTNPLYENHMVDNLHQFKQNISKSDNDTSLTAYHVAMLLP